MSHCSVFRQVKGAKNTKTNIKTWILAFGCWDTMGVRMHHSNTIIHTPVLLDGVLSYLDPVEGESYLDVTAGYGGHAQAVLAQTHAPRQMTLIDRDADAVNVLEELFAADGAEVVHTDYEAACTAFVAEGRHYDMIVADLGISSLHVDHADRGFSFGKDGPLDMRMDVRQTTTAADLVNDCDESDLVRILRDYGEEHRASIIAQAIMRARPLHTTSELAEVVNRATPRQGRVHPATKTFQALRIAVNDELGQLERALPLWLHLLAPKGRLVVISFHSLEDRLVKKTFAEVSGERYDADYILLTKHPVVADDSETVSNPRARSAKLRALQRK